MRMVLELIIFPHEDRAFSEWAALTIQEEICYGAAGTVLIKRSKEVSKFPIPVKMYCLQKKGKNVEYENYDKTLVERGWADFGEIDLTNPIYAMHGRGINTIDAA